MWCAQRLYLTFWHWSGVTPYTSSYEFAGSCVFGKQLPEILSLRPMHHATRDARFKYLNISTFKFRITCNVMHGEALSRSYGCFFAEFLGDHSLVRLGLIDLITCVGLRYGFYIHKFRDFSWKRALYHYLIPKNKTFLFSFMRHLRHSTDFPIEHNQDTNFKSNNERYILPSVIPSQNTKV